MSEILAALEEIREMQRNANKKCGSLWEPDRKANAYLHAGRSQGLGMAADILDKAIREAGYES